jgi:hypothetical protein
MFVLTSFDEIVANVDLCFYRETKPINASIAPYGAGNKGMGKCAENSRQEG